MKYLVTGSSGFIGSHLVAHLVEQGNTVAAVSRSERQPDGTHPSRLSGTVVDVETVSRWINDEKPDVIVHLAAQSLPSVSWEDPAGTYEVNVNGTMNLLTELHRQRHQARFVMISSSSVYAPSENDSPISEDGRLFGSSPYAWSKLAAEQGALLYGQHTGLDVVSVRPFFIIGPGKAGDVSSDFARRIVAVERGEAEGITVGRLDITRDFLDVHDAVRGIDAIVNKGKSGDVYNLCSGRGTMIRGILDTLKSLSYTEINERVDETLIRPIDEMVKVGDPGKLQALDWTPSVSLEDSLGSILHYWRDKA